MGNVQVRFANYWVTKAGERRWIAWSNTVTTGPDGRPQYFIKTGIDRTESKQAEDRLAGIIGIAGDAIISIDDEQRIVMYNQGAETIFGWSAAEVIGQDGSIFSFRSAFAAPTGSTAGLRARRRDVAPDGTSGCPQSSAFGRTEKSSRRRPLSPSSISAAGCLFTVVLPRRHGGKSAETRIGSSWQTWQRACRDARVRRHADPALRASWYGTWPIFASWTSSTETESCDERRCSIEIQARRRCARCSSDFRSSDRMRGRSSVSSRSSLA